MNTHQKTMLDLLQRAHDVLHLCPLREEIGTFLKSPSKRVKVRRRTGTCPRCKTKKVPLTFEPNPYNVDIHKDHTPEWMCEKCQKDCLDSI